MLGQAKVQRLYRVVTIVFLGLVGLTFGGVVYAGWSRTIITVTPKRTALTTSFPITVSPDPSTATGVRGTVTKTTRTASATAKPSDVGLSVPAHARGTITLHNEGSAAQSLATQTRLQATSGVIVRIAERVIVPAGGTVDVTAVADPLGAEGEIAPGRLTIVALRPANQQLIYGTVAEAFTGGLEPRSGTLSVDELTKTSNEAQSQISAAVGADQPGRLVVLRPQEVATDPKPDVPSAEYQVTVTVEVLDIRYETESLRRLVEQSLTAQLGDDQELVTIGQPELTFDQQPTLESALVTAKARGQAELSATSAMIQPQRFVGLDRQAILVALLGSNLIESAEVQISPRWRRHAPSEAARIEVRLQRAS
ncbi:MAG: hypothetical protein HYY50_03840 [Candidatus Kerfeldbacteria bacterium]|nr:hypothetical protein [Candidatus Kerfeldbacteria bacterium]